MEFLRHKLHFWQGTTHKLNPSKRYIAVEIECSGASMGGAIETVATNWRANIVEDGSLPTGGFEINTAPASGDKFIEQVEQFGRALLCCGACATDDCGLHVHVDARDLTYYDIRRVIKLYAKVEPALFAMVSPGRRESSYCAPCGARLLHAVELSKVPKESKKAILTTLYEGSDTRTIRGWRRPYREASMGKSVVLAPVRSEGSKYMQCRYDALNVHSWVYRGTLELRLPNGTVKSNKIIGWGLLFAGLVDTAVRLTEKGIDALSTTPTETLKMCCIGQQKLISFIDARIAKFE